LDPVPGDCVDNDPRVACNQVTLEVVTTNAAGDPLEDNLIMKLVKIRNLPDDTSATTQNEPFTVNQPFLDFHLHDGTVRGFYHLNVLTSQSNFGPNGDQSLEPGEYAMTLFVRVPVPSLDPPFIDFPFFDDNPDENSVKVWNAFIKNTDPDTWLDPVDEDGNTLEGDQVTAIITINPAVEDDDD